MNINGSMVPMVQYLLVPKILMGMILETARCPECLEKVEVDYQLDSKIRLALFLLACPACHWTKFFCTSRVIKGKQRLPNYEINLTSIIAFREYGVGYDGIKTFCGVVNMPPPMNKTAFQKSSKSIMFIQKLLMYQ